MSSSPSLDARPHILVPMDLTALGERALDFAAELARHGEGRLTILAVPRLYHLDLAAFQPYPGGRMPPDHIAPPAELIEESAREAQAYLEAMASRVSETGLAVETRLVRDLPARAIVDLAADCRCDLVVMGTHGRGGVVRLAIGSVTDKVLQAADCPVLVLRGDMPRRPRDLDRILVPLDGSALAEQCLPAVASLARAFAAELRLCQVAIPFDSLPVELVGPLLAREDDYLTGLRDYLETRATELRAEGLEVTTEILRGEDVAETLHRRASAEDIDLVALTSHGRGGLRRWAFGSVTDWLVRHSESPVLVVRGQA